MLKRLCILVDGNKGFFVINKLEMENGIMESYNFLLFLAIILISTKVLGIISKKVHMPQVVGALVAGIILGPSFLGIISLEGTTGTFLECIAEVGVIFLMFSAGLGTELSELKENWVSALVVATIGVIVPVAGGFAGYAIFFHVPMNEYDEILKAVFVGVVLSATSVSITVETLRELGRLKGKVGTTILGAAVIDDILGIVVLTIVTSLQDSSVKISIVLLKIVLYFVMIAILTFILLKFKRFLEQWNRQRRIAILAVSFCLILSFISETVFGIADITGAYFAGLILCTTEIGPYVSRRVEIASYLFFSPVFFAGIGLKTSLSGFNMNILAFSILLLLIAIFSKIIGCGLGAKITGFTSKESVQIGIGMISRGEVALIVAQKGYQCNLLNDTLFAPIVLVVIVTTLITPILLKIVMKDSSTPDAQAVS